MVVFMPKGKWKNYFQVMVEKEMIGDKTGEDQNTWTS